MWDEEFKSLKARIQLLQPRKRAIVKPNPNEKFVNIEQIMKAKEETKAKEELEQRRAEAWQRDHSPERDINQHSFEELCSQYIALSLLLRCFCVAGGGDVASCSVCGGGRP